MAVFYQIFSQRLVVVGGGLETEGDLRQPMPYSERFCVKTELLESFPGGIEGELLKQGLPPCRAEEGIVTVFCDIDTDQEVFFRSSNLTLHLTKHPEPAIIVLIHREPPRRMCGVEATIQKILTGGFFFGSLIIKGFFCYSLGYVLGHGVYITPIKLSLSPHIS
jgi:hypothetical protein